MVLGGITVATPARAGFDLARYLRGATALAHLDALARATRITKQDLTSLVDRYPGARGNKRARLLIDMMDPGAESPKESLVEACPGHCWICPAYYADSSHRWPIRRIPRYGLGASNGRS
ncbi:MAG TPA: type IV toxin-antitoxin system AbiEi family antitoxin [Mycobacterium sp.]